MRAVCAEIGARRERVAARLAQEFPCKIYPSDANFLFVEPTQHAAVDVFEALKAQKVLVRYFRQNGLERFFAYYDWNRRGNGVILQCLERGVEAEQSANDGRYTVTWN